MTARSPDYIVKAMDKSTDVKSGRIGAGWANPDGSVSISIDPFIVLNGGPNLVLTVFPRDYVPAPKAVYADALMKKANK